MDTVNDLQEKLESVRVDARAVAARQADIIRRFEGILESKEFTDLRQKLLSSRKEDDIDLYEELEEKLGDIAYTLDGRYDDGYFWIPSTC